MPNITKSDAQPSSKWHQAADPNTLKSLFMSPTALAQIEQVAAKHLTADRLMNIALSVINAPAKAGMRLLDCTPHSLLQAIKNLAEVGLEPGGALQHAYLVPYKEKGKGGQPDRVLARATVSYMGFIELARRSGLLHQVEARVVHEKDKFDLRFGIEQKLEHVPYFGGPPGKPLLVYSIARFKDGGFHVDTMSIAEVDAIRSRSPAGQSGPWVTDYEEMAKKTVVRRARKYWPQSRELAAAAALDDDEDTNIALAPAERPFQVISDRGLERDLNLPRETAPAAEVPEYAEVSEPGEETEGPMKAPEGDDPLSGLVRKILGAKDREALDELEVEGHHERKNMNDAEWSDVTRALAQRKSELA